MADTNFNFNHVVQNSAKYLEKDYTAAGHAAEQMEQAEKVRVEQAIKFESAGFLGITLGQKLTDAGIGRRVAKQLVDTATGAVGRVVSPLSEYLDKYENVFNGTIQAEFNGDAYQLYSASNAMAEEALNTPNIVGLGPSRAPKFVMDM